MPRKPSSRPDLVALPQLSHETLYVGVDVGKRAHVAGFLSSTLLTRHQRFEHCPALAFDNSREGFRALLDRIQTYVPLTQVQALLEVTGHYHRALLQYLQELDIPVYVIHVQKRQEGLLKTDKRDAALVWPTSYTTNWRKAFKSVILCKPSAGSSLPPRPQHSCVGWSSITMNSSPRAPSAKTS